VLGGQSRRYKMCFIWSSRFAILMILSPTTINAASVHFQTFL